jgi:hypothetical protein
MKHQNFRFAQFAESLASCDRHATEISVYQM